MELKKLLVAALSSAVVFSAAPLTCPVVTKAAENVMEDGSVQYAVVSSVDEFRDYIDSDGVYASQDAIETKWSGYTDVHKIVLNEPGTLYLAALAGDNDVNIELFGNYALTAKIGESIRTVTSNRAGLNGFELDAGTYYYRGSRWNGYSVPFVVTVYAGFVPDDPLLVGSVSNVYSNERNDAIPVNEIPVVQDADGLKDWVMSDGQFAWQDNIETK